MTFWVIKMKTLLAISLFVLIGFSTGCASLVGVASEEGLKRMPPTKRASYREALNDADDIIHEAKSQYDARYDVDGNLIPVDPVTPVE